MFDTGNHHVREVGLSRVKLRTDLRITPQSSGGQPYCVIEDPLNSRFFRLGHAEYTFVSLLDGETSILDALSHLSSVMPHHHLSADDAAGLCRWVVEMDLGQTSDSANPTRLARKRTESERLKSAARWNPLVVRLPLLRPDSLFSVLHAWLGWLYTPGFAVVWLLLLAIGAFQVAAHWETFVASSRGIFASSNWFWLAACWVGLKVVHETAHGVVCRRYGGTVRETGLLFILCAPLAYVDVTSSWRFRSRRQRMHVAAAGMYMELMVAAVAAIIWSRCSSHTMQNLCFNIIVMAGLTTIVFNANPLMKFDGYYILSDALGLPNLYVNGQSYLRYWARRWLLSVPAILPEWSSRQTKLIAAYGWASWMWRLLVCISLMVTAATLFHGAGLVLAALAIVLWIGIPTARFVKYLVVGNGDERPNRIRFALITASAVCGGVLVCLAPWPGVRVAPAVVAYSPRAVVRAASPGFVAAVHVDSGQTVMKGQLIVELRNLELENELLDLELQVEQSLIRSRQHEQKGALAAQQAESEQRRALQSHLDVVRSQVEQLDVRAPRAGRVVRRNLHAILGTYLAAGDEIVSLGHESRKELRLSIDQDDLDAFRQREGQRVGVNIVHRDLSTARLVKVIPRATIAPAHPSLAAVNGGPLPVQNVPGGNDNADDQLELLEPCFEGVVELLERESLHLRTGQRGQVWCRPCDESVGEHLYYAASRWIHARLENTRSVR